jgi:hypothetical protein
MRNFRISSPFRPLFKIIANKKCICPSITHKDDHFAKNTALKLDEKKKKFNFGISKQFVLKRYRFVVPRFLTNEAFVTIVPSKERQHSENSFTRVSVQIQ